MFLFSFFKVKQSNKQSVICFHSFLSLLVRWSIRFVVFAFSFCLCRKQSPSDSPAFLETDNQSATTTISHNQTKKNPNKERLTRASSIGRRLFLFLIPLSAPQIIMYCSINEINQMKSNENIWNESPECILVDNGWLQSEEQCFLLDQFDWWNQWLPFEEDESPSHCALYSTNQQKKEWNTNALLTFELPTWEEFGVIYLWVCKFAMTIKSNQSINELTKRKKEREVSYKPVDINISSFQPLCQLNCKAEKVNNDLLIANYSPRFFSAAWWMRP